ncbi:MAG: type I phosphomannose isomerase catalytic subunit [Bacteroidota bacterium]|nr:type I phosphomannose isomerase catalytic subunit [Bacteroidota bacterium]
MNELYPLKFKPVFKDKIWGGQKMKQFKGMDFSPLPNCGEAWVLSGVKGNESIIENGFLAGNNLNEVMEVYMYDLVGDKHYETYGNEFPILVKLIDANDWLSIQVHPDDKLAARRKIGRGKTEMWYILGSDKNAEIITGFNKKVDKSTYKQHLDNKSLKNILNFEKAERGDVFFMPAGRVHALGPGIFLAEIQQTSDTTYRIYDWNRVDDQGKSREIHTELALDAIDFNVYNDYKSNPDIKQDQTANLVNCPYFTTNLIKLSGHSLEKEISELDSFIIYLCVKGKVELLYTGGNEYLEAGEVALIPAIMENLILNPEGDSEILEVYIV